jgi:hypothetical protein
MMTKLIHVQPAFYNKFDKVKDPSNDLRFIYYLCSRSLQFTEHLGLHFFSEICLGLYKIFPNISENVVCIFVQSVVSSSSI